MKAEIELNYSFCDWYFKILNFLSSQLLFFT